ncbi:MAG: glycosyltransferase [Nitrospiraceae bacterium]|nr:MAG: glycosyltransferase [Nitrospiraceae bacterium]
MHRERNIRRPGRDSGGEGWPEWPLSIAILSIHSNPFGKLGTQDAGGMNVYIRELSHELSRQGHRIDIYTRIEGQRGTHEIVHDEGIRLIHVSTGHGGHVPKNRLYEHLPEVFRGMENLLVNNGRRYHLIHSNYWLSGQLGEWVSRSLGAPHITMFHTTGLAKNIRCSEEHEPALRSITEKKIAHRADRILASTGHEKNDLCRFFGVPREKISIVPCGVNLERFRPVPRKEARRQLGLAQEIPVILFVGRLAPIKGLDRLLAAVACLHHVRGLKLIVAGGDDTDGHTPEKFRNLARRLGAAGAVTFAGRVDHDELSVYYSAADVLALPSYYESFGLVALEALACGTPVVAAPVGAVESIIKQGETGIVVSHPSPRTFGRALEEILRQAREGAISAEVVRASVLHHGWGGVAAATCRMYMKSLCDRSSLHECDAGPDRSDSCPAAVPMQYCERTGT